MLTFVISKKHRSATASISWVSYRKSAKLADTLVALLRLPRGDDPASQGILHNLIADLDLCVGSRPV